MEGTLELQRRAHEEIDRLEQAMADELLRMPQSHKGRLITELTVSNLLRQISATSRNLLSLYADEDGSRQADIDAKTITQGDFGNFYTHLKQIKDAHRRTPNDQPIDNLEFQALLKSCRPTEEAFDALFSGEESWGRFLDLVASYDRYVNLKNVRKLDYLQYLQDFDNFEAIPTTTRSSTAYSKYLSELEAYFVGFFARAKPLFDVAAMKSTEVARFEEQWTAPEVKKNVDVGAGAGAGAGAGVYCEPCGKNFANPNVYQAHLTGKKHLKALENPANPATASAKVSKTATSVENSEEKKKYLKMIALNEHLVGKYAEILGEIREETRGNVERKQSRTFDEREEDIEEEIEVAATEQAAADKENEDDGRIYNPLNLPLDWDGKPIPYWLWKLHGLGVKFPCEICGNHIYMGRKAFDQHFFEWRHANGMKALGIPNTKHFFQITTIEEALQLWDKLKQINRTENFRPEAMEEFEDHMGNVYNRKTYEDLRRQGLI